MKQTYTRKELVAELAQRGYSITFERVSQLTNGQSVVSKGKRYTYPPRLLLGVDYNYDSSSKYRPLVYAQTAVTKIIEAIKPIKQPTNN